jgi:RNA polymerase sigma-70 factor, ECF subfamily
MAFEERSHEGTTGKSAGPDQAEPSDIELAGQAATGDMVAFETIYRRHMRKVYALCLRMTGNPTEAEDLTQEVFTHLFRKISSFRGKSAFTTWLHRLTINLVLMHFRRRQSRPEFTSNEDETPDQIVRGTENPDAMLVIDRLSLEKAIAELAPGYRSIFLLHDVEGYEHEEIAEMLGISSGTSKSQLHKARLNLRKLLKRQAPPVTNEQAASKG